MKCIFCYNDSSQSKSVEHIIPESLGNTQFILEKGWVCDKCNNYFSRTFEQQLLELPFFKQVRHELNIKSKKGRIPSDKGFTVDPDLFQVEFLKDKHLNESFHIPKEAIDSEELAIFIPVFNSPGYQNPHVSKFLGKMGVEALAWYALWYKTPVEDNVNQSCFEDIKKYVRAGAKEQFWPYYERSLYDPRAGFQHSETGEYFKVTSSFTFIYTDTNQVLFQYLCMGAEFTIDLINPDVEEYKNWLMKNNQESPVLKQVFTYKY